MPQRFELFYGQWGVDSRLILSFKRVFAPAVAPFLIRARAVGVVARLFSLLVQTLGERFEVHGPVAMLAESGKLIGENCRAETDKKGESQHVVEKKHLLNLNVFNDVFAHVLDPFFDNFAELLHCNKAKNAD